MRKNNAFCLMTVVLSVFIMLFSSCEYNKYYEEKCTNCDSNNNDDSGTTQDYVVGFNAQVNSLQTKAGTSPLPAGRYMIVYTYFYRGDYIKSTTYTTETAGVLSPVKSPLTLESGDYEFYMYCVNDKDVMPTLTLDQETASLSGLSNGYDYLSYNIVNQTVNSDLTFDVTLSHACSQIILNISENGSPVDDITSVTIQQPLTTSSSLFLSSGKIISSTKKDTSVINMVISGSSANQVVIPYINANAPDFDIQIVAGGVTYNGSVNVPSGRLSGGSSYVFAVELESNFTITPSEANVTDWTEVDDQGNPVIVAP